MHELYELKEMLMDELKEYGKKEMTSGTLEVVDKLSHALKNLCKIIESYEEEEYSQAGGESGQSRRGGGSSYRRGGGSSYARGGQGGGQGGSSYARGRNARRDSMGRYSREGYSGAADEIVEELRGLMEEAPEARQEFQRLIQKIEQM